MNVFILTAKLNGREVIVDDVHHVSDVKASRTDTGGDHDGRSASSEASTNEQSVCASDPAKSYSHSVFPLELGSLGMNRGSWKALVEEEVINEVYGFLGSDEDQGSCRW